MAIDSTAPRSRRSLLMGVLGGAAGAIAATLAGAVGRPDPVHAADGGNVILGSQNNTATGTTKITATQAAFIGSSVSGVGLEGFSTSNVGVAGFSDSDTGVFGQSESKDGVYGQSVGAGVGVRAETFSGAAVAAFSGTSGTGHAPPASTGVYGESSSGRGGVFRGQKAQIKLNPSSAASHPSTGAKGDLFVDKSGRLWFCKGGTNWRQIA